MHQANFAEEHKQEQHLFYANQESSSEERSWYLESGCRNHMGQRSKHFHKHI